MAASAKLRLSRTPLLEGAAPSPVPGVSAVSGELRGDGRLRNCWLGRVISLLGVPQKWKKRLLLGFVPSQRHVRERFKAALRKELFLAGFESQKRGGA